MQDIKRELRDSGSNTNTKICSRFESLLYVPAFMQKDFHYVHIGPSTKGPPPRNYNSTLRVHSSSLNNKHLYTRGSTKQKKIHLVIIKITNKASH